MSEENESGKRLFKIIRIIILIIAIAFSGYILYQKISSKVLNSQENVNIVENDLYNDSRIKNFASKHKSILKNIDIVKVEDCLFNERSYACITLKNKSNRALNNLLVVIDLYDKEGNAITDLGDSIKSFAVDAEYTFKIPLRRENIAYWELSNIDEY